MAIPRRSRRDEQRKFRRIEVRYGADKPIHRGFAIQLSSKGAFLSAGTPVYAVGSHLHIEFSIPAGTFVATAVVRHAKNLPPQVARFGKTGMGIEILSAPAELRDYLSDL